MGEENDVTENIGVDLGNDQLVHFSEPPCLHLLNGNNSTSPVLIKGDQILKKTLDKRKGWAYSELVRERP